MSDAVEPDAVASAGEQVLAVGSATGPAALGDGGRDADWPAVRVLVAGLGVSGAAAAVALAGLGARVVGVDARGRAALGAAADRLAEAGVELVLPAPLDDAGAPGLLAGVDLVVTSPGWRPDAPLLVAATRAGVPIWGEVELAWRLRPAGQRWLCLTGTNGKTTTVGMLESILRAAGLRALAVGNVGVPLVEAALAEPAWEVLAVELSSFQLHWTTSLRATASAVLNVAPDHLDWHGSLEEYAAAKARVHRGSGAAVYNAADPATEQLARASDAARVIGFTLDVPAPNQLGVVEDLLVDRAWSADPATDADEIGTLADVRSPGAHNVANALAAAALARAVGVPPEAIGAGLRAFAPGAHRNVQVGTVDGVPYVDDSKATNPHAALASLLAYPSVVWLAGGLAKGNEFDDLVADAAGHVRAAVLFGTARHDLAAALARHAPQVPVVVLDAPDTGPVNTAVEDHPVMGPAVQAAARLAGPGDTVLLAPACASMDQFRDYGHRGKAFAAAVAALSAPGSHAEPR